MIDCMVVGDSIAVGIHQQRPECVSYSKGGINSHQWLNKYGDKTPLQAKHVIISLGSNDHKYVKTRAELSTLRQLTNAERVYWILPTKKPDIQEDIYAIAALYGDIVLPITRTQKDGIHPSTEGYKQLSSKTK